MLIRHPTLRHTTAAGHLQFCLTAPQSVPRQTMKTSLPLHSDAPLPIQARGLRHRSLPATGVSLPRSRLPTVFALILHCIQERPTPMLITLGCFEVQTSANPVHQPQDNSNSGHHQDTPLRARTISRSRVVASTRSFLEETNAPQGSRFKSHAPLVIAEQSRSALYLKTTLSTVL